MSLSDLLGEILARWTSFPTAFLVASLAMIPCIQSKSNMYSATLAIVSDMLNDREEL